MAMMLEIWSHKESRSVIHFLLAVYVSPVKIQFQVIEVYVDIMGGQRVRKWCRVFASGQMGIHNGDCIIGPSISRMVVNAAQLEVLILEN
jgi:hypothetical protein